MTGILNWTRDEFITVTKEAFATEKKPYICLDVEHSDRKNMGDIMHWAQQEGYRTKEVNSDTIKISKAGWFLPAQNNLPEGFAQHPLCTAIKVVERFPLICQKLLELLDETFSLKV